MAIFGIIAGGGLALFTQKMGLIPVLSPKPLVMTQSPGDPPIIIGDGSLHVHSKNGWANDVSAGVVIKPSGTSFTSSNNCGTFGTAPAKAFLWTDEDATYDISPANFASWQVVITNDSNHQNAVVTVSAPGGVLQITASQGATFDPNANYDVNNRQLHPHSASVSDVVTSIKVQGTTSTSYSVPNGEWDAKSPHHPHYTLGFCYQ